MELKRHSNCLKTGGGTEATRDSREREILREGVLIMTDASIVERDVIIPTDSDTSHSPFSWSAAIAGAFAAVAVTFIVTALGSGIGMSFASPFGHGPSATSLTIAAAV